MKTGISYSELLEFIPKDLVESLEKETRVNYQSKKISGKILLNLILFSLLSSDKISLRIMEEIYASEQFKIISQRNNRKVKFNSISERISHINPIFFERIFEHLSAEFKHIIKKGNKAKSQLDLSIYDSTIVSLSAKLLKNGMRLSGDKKQIKFTFGFDGAIPESVKVFKNQKEISEEIALKRAILEKKEIGNSITVFDRGLQSRKTFCEFSNQGISFVTRLKSKISYIEVRTFKNICGRKTKTLRLEKDIIIKLKNENGKPTDKEFRLIIARSIKTNDEISFLTNLTNLNAREITEIYKRRWEIEVFFKYLKQELNFKHFVSRSENGIKVMLFSTLILALLLLVFKEKNRITSYKIAKLRFSLQMEMEIMKEIVIYCGGDISKFFQARNPRFD